MSSSPVHESRAVLAVKRPSRCAASWLASERFQRKGLSVLTVFCRIVGAKLSEKARSQKSRTSGWVIGTLHTLQGRSTSQQQNLPTLQHDGTFLIFDSNPSHPNQRVIAAVSSRTKKLCATCLLHGQGVPPSGATGCPDHSDSDMFKYCLGYHLL